MFDWDVWRQLAPVFRTWKRRLSRSEWTSRLLRLSRAAGTAELPGLVLIQIDGLSRARLVKAMQDGHLPFLSRLCEREQYVVRSLYSGLPSNTPAFQAEFFYGVKSAVPAFSFVDRESRQIIRMFSPAAAEMIQKRLETQGPGLLAGGSAYGDIFSGGADEPHFCAAKLGWEGVRRAAHPFVFPWLMALHLETAGRVAWLMLVEFALAISDFLRGVLTGKTFMKEMEFLLDRIGPVILLRELVVWGAGIDAARGLPVIHVNLIGYDDHAHCRGPDSASARWPMKGVDASVARIWRAARNSHRRNYEVWVYSDHGQEATQAYPKIAGMSLRSAIEAACADLLDAHRIEAVEDASDWPTPTRRAQVFVPLARSAEPGAAVEPPPWILTAMGSVGHMYLPPGFTEAQIDEISQRLITICRVPAVAVPGPGTAIRVRTPEGVFQLPEDAARVLGADHPFLEEAAADLLAVCRHPSAGALVLFGWCAGQQPMTFPVEYGAHAGFGPEETHAFALLPPDAPLPLTARTYMRPLDLRQSAQQLLGRVTEAKDTSRRRTRKARALRVMTYNVHRCIGVDGVVSPERIARVIARYEPDIVALQEVDVGAARTSKRDQAQLIAGALRMSHHFYPVLALAEGHYGNAILSCEPMRLVRTGRLPQWVRWNAWEPRGAMWAVLELDGHTVQMINCHLSTWPYERRIQMKALTGPDWLGDPACRPPVLVCGDFNTFPGSPVHRQLSGVLRDTQEVLHQARRQYTWLSLYPIGQIDYVFASAGVEVEAAHVPRSELAKSASDHLPLIIDLVLPT